MEMDISKGFWIPHIHELSDYYEDGYRSPYDGELCLDEENNIHYWIKDENNIFKTISRTQEIQKLIDSYGSQSEGGDGTFLNAQAYYLAGVIHRLFFNQDNQTVWLDDSFDFSSFSYWAIISLNLDKGKRRYVTGLVDSDGSNYLDALIPISQTKGTLTQSLVSNNWYTVEFYNEDKKLVYSTNYMAILSKNMLFDSHFESVHYTKEGERKEVTNTVTNARLEFDRVDSEGNYFVYQNESIDSINPIIVLTMADNHEVRYRYNEEISDGQTSVKFSSFIKKLNANSLNTKIVGNSINYIVQFNMDLRLFTPIDKIVEVMSKPNQTTAFKTERFVIDYYTDYIKGERTLYKITEDTSVSSKKTYYTYNPDTKKYVQMPSNFSVFENDVVYYELSGTEDTYTYNESQKPITVKIAKSNSEWFNRNYRQISIRGIGNADSTSCKDYVLDNTSEENYDIITIPSSYFKTGKNVITVSYCESTEHTYVETEPFKITLEAPVIVKSRPEKHLEKLYAVGYIDTSLGTTISFKFFGMTKNNKIENVTADTTILSLDGKKFDGKSFEYGVSHTLMVSVYGDQKDFYVFCLDPNFNTKARIIIGGTNESDYGVLLYSAGQGANPDFTLALSRKKLGETREKEYESTFQEIFNVIPTLGDATHIRVKKVNVSDGSEYYMTNYEGSNPTFTYKPTKTIVHDFTTSKRKRVHVLDAEGFENAKSQYVKDENGNYKEVNGNKILALYPEYYKDNSCTVQDALSELGVTIYGGNYETYYTVSLVTFRSVTAMNKSLTSSRNLNDILSNGIVIDKMGSIPVIDETYTGNTMYIFNKRGTPENYEFLGYSLDRRNVATAEELEAIVLNTQTSYHLYALYKKIENSGNGVSLNDTIPDGWMGQIYVTYTQSGSVSNNEPLLVEGYKKDNNKWICTGAAVFFASRVSSTA